MDAALRDRIELAAANVLTKPQGGVEQARVLAKAIVQEVERLEAVEAAERRNPRQPNKFLKLE